MQEEECLLGDSKPSQHNNEKFAITSGFFFKKIRAGEMAEQLRTHAAFSDGTGSVPSTHMVAHSCL